MTRPSRGSRTRLKQQLWINSRHVRIICLIQSWNSEMFFPFLSNRSCCGQSKTSPGTLKAFASSQRYQFLSSHSLVFKGFSAHIIVRAFQPFSTHYCSLFKDPREIAPPSALTGGIVHRSGKILRDRDTGTSCLLKSDMYVYLERGIIESILSTTCETCLQYRILMFQGFINPHSFYCTQVAAHRQFPKRFVQIQRARRQLGRARANR